MLKGIHANGEVDEEDLDDKVRPCVRLRSPDQKYNYILKQLNKAREEQERSYEEMLERKKTKVRLCP
jgi:hypothetical protein